MLRPTADPATIEQLLDLNVILTVSSRDDAVALNGIASARSTVAEAHLKIDTGMAGVGEDKIRKIVIAYEPIWAIGTGKTASPEQAEEVCEHIRTVIRKLYGAKIARAISVLYGGSMSSTPRSRTRPT